MNLCFNTKSAKVSQIKRNNLPIWWSSEQWQFKSYVLVLFRKANSFNEDIRAKKIKFVGQSEVCEITTNLLVVLISYLFLFICTYFTHFRLTDKFGLFSQISSLQEVALLKSTSPYDLNCHCSGLRKIGRFFYLADFGGFRVYIN